MDASQRLPAMISFVRAAEQGSFAAAGRALGISAAAVGKNVAGLEAALGVRLFNRTTRSLTLTAEGADFVGQVRAAIGLIDEAVERIAAQRAEPAGRVRLTVGSSFGRAFVLPLLPALTAALPRVRLEIDFDDRVVDLVREGYDLALRGGVIEDNALISRPVCRFGTVLAAAPDYLARNGVPRRVADLAAHRQIAVRFLSSGVSRWRFAAEDGGIVEHVPDAALTVSDPEAAVLAALQGIGIAQIGTHHAWAHLQAGSLRLLLLAAHRPVEREFVLQYPHRAHLAPRVRAVAEWLLARLREEPALQLTREVLARFQA